MGEKKFVRSDRCQVCGKPAMVCLEGIGNFCMDCYNAYERRQMGLGEDLYPYRKTLQVEDPEGKVHTFDLEHMLLGDCVAWTAREREGEYLFNQIQRPDMNRMEAEELLVKKVQEGVQTPTLKHRNSIGDKGVITVTDDVDDGDDCDDSCGFSSTAFVVDGKQYSGQELAELFSGYVGFNIQYQVHDATDPLPGRDDYLIRVRLDEETVRQRLESAIAAFSREDVLSIDGVRHFNLVYCPLVRELGQAAEVNPEKIAPLAEKVSERLWQLCSDQEGFPDREVYDLLEAVDPLQRNERLWKECWARHI